MAFKAFVAITIIALSGISEARNVCGPYEVFKECGSPCDEKCVTDDMPLICPAMCVSGCYCEEGMVRSPVGTCIPKKNCNLLRLKDVEEPKCGPNAFYNECGTACETQCGKADPEICTFQCVSGCFCKPGFIKNENGECITQIYCDALLEAKKQDEPVCGPNAYYTDCGSACEKKCGGPDNLFCTKQCVPGCYCQPGFIKNEEGQCITQRNCNALLKAKREISFVVEKEVCGENEEFTTCGSSCGPTCQNPFGPWVCPDNCIQGCVCKDGYIRNDKLECVQYFNC